MAPASDLRKDPLRLPLTPATSPAFFRAFPPPYHPPDTRKDAVHDPAVNNLLEAARKATEAFLEGYMEGLDLPSNLVDAMGYALLGGGKRLRPVLCFQSAAACGHDPARSVPGGAAVELIHAFSLVHDDLPAMDDDDLRRGKPTLHVHAGEAMAILAGDAMLTLAFELAATRSAPDPATRLAIVGELTAGTNAMIAGQVVDTLGGVDDAADDRARLEYIHHNKTGALLIAAARIGVRAVGGSEKNLGDITEYARAVGLTFQIVDDLLDVTGSAEHIGKRTGKDEDAGKLTWPGVFGVEGSQKEVDRLVEVAIAAAGAFGTAGDPLAKLAVSMARRTK
jgi:geranylgeranyl diphosphate synthase, type II